MKSEETTPAKPRSKRKPPANVAPVGAPVVPEPVAANANVGELESVLSLFAGMLLVIAALFPRSIKQLLLLALGGGFLYRGLTSKCHFYNIIGFDTARDSLLRQINERLLSPASSKEE